MTSVVEKVCSRCGQSYPRTAEFFFWSAKRRGDGFDGYCRVCRGRYAAERYAARQVLCPPKPVKVEKRCPTCGVTKPATLEFFRPGKRRKDGTATVGTPCRTCAGAYYKAYAKTYQRPVKPKKERVKVCVRCGVGYPSGREHFARKAPYCRACGQVALEQSIVVARAQRADLSPTRQCGKCDEVKPNTLEFFYAGAGATCKECWKTRTRTYLRTNPEARRAKGQNRRAREKAAGGSIRKRDVTLKLQQQGGRCYWCQEPLGGSYHVDHVIALAKGGTNGPENICCACADCNHAKAAKMPWEFAGRLL